MFQSFIEKGIQNFSQNDSVFLLVISVIALLFLVLFIWKSCKLRKITQALLFEGMIVNCLEKSDKIEDQLNNILDLIMKLIKTEGYFFYIFDPKKKSYLLKKSRGKAYDITLELGYGGLVPYQERGYYAPLGVEGPPKGGGLAIIRDQETSLLEISLAQGLGLIRLGPIAVISPKQRKALQEISLKVSPIIDNLVQVEIMKNDLKHFQEAGRVLEELANKVPGPEQKANQVMAACAQVIKAGGCCLAFEYKDQWEFAMKTNAMGEWERQFYDDFQTLSLLYSLLEERSSCYISSECRNFYVIPYYFVASGIETLLLVKVECLNRKGMAVFWTKHIYPIEDSQVKLVEIMCQRLGEAWELHQKISTNSGKYISELKTVIEKIEKANPCKTSHAKRVAKYSLIIAKQLQLPAKMMTDLKLAAYFHDLGMANLPLAIVNKEGRYTGAEYEKVKQHSEDGAAIISSTIANDQIASYIRHHHESWDGFGYPRGLKGEEIPFGARIIAVAEQFASKFEERSYRTPLSYEQAVNDLLASAGSQLDPVLVWVLISWFKKKQTDTSKKGLTLVPCWQMTCCLDKENCAAFGKGESVCWEINKGACAQSEKKCQTCIVRTEFMYRMKNTPAEEEFAVG